MSRVLKGDIVEPLKHDQINLGKEEISVFSLFPYFGKTSGVAGATLIIFRSIRTILKDTSPPESQTFI